MTEQPPQSEEQVALVVHRHWIAFALQLVGVAIPGFIILGLLWVVRMRVGETGIVAHALLSMLVPFSFLIIWVIFCVLWTNYYLDVLVVTDRRVFYTSQLTLTSRAVEQWNISEIRHVVAHVSGFLQSFFNYGTLEIEASGLAPVDIEGVPDPERVSSLILKQDERYGQAIETVEQQRELLRFLSHEVKGHLTKSKAAFAAIAEGDLGPVSAPLQSFATTALSDSQKGVETVMSILENSDAKRGTLQMDMKLFDLSETLRRMVGEFQPAAMQKKLSLGSRIDAFCIIKGDEKKLERHVIRNLLDNAIRYTPHGSVTVALHKELHLVRLTIADTGVGISSEDTEKLFQAGGYGEHARDVNPESTGYGLFIAKRIVDAHGGHIGVRSAGMNAGSEFFVELPLAH